MHRTIANEISPEERVKVAIEELLKGRNPWEAKKGYSSAIPKDVKLLGIIIKNDTVELNFSQNLARYGGGTEMVRLILGQIVFTATQFSNIKKVIFLIEGKNEEIVLGSEGFIIDKPLGREDVRF